MATTPTDPDNREAKDVRVVSLTLRNAAANDQELPQFPPLPEGVLEPIFSRPLHSAAVQQPQIRSQGGVWRSEFTGQRSPQWVWPTGDGVTGGSKHSSHVFSITGVVSTAPGPEEDGVGAGNEALRLGDLPGSSSSPRSEGTGQNCPPGGRVGVARPRTVLYVLDHDFNPFTTEHVESDKPMHV